LSKKSIIGSQNEKNSKNQHIKSKFLAISAKWFFVFVLALNFICIVPAKANASIISVISDFLTGNSQKTDSQTTDDNSQNVPLLTNTTNFDLGAAVGGGDISTTDDGESLISESGPSGTLADISNTVITGQISKYTVKKGDTLGSIANMYGVTKNTIIWANDITGGSVKEGQALIILPVSGTLHIVVKGDTLKSIAKKYNADLGEVAQFNDLDSKSQLTVGDTIIIPNGEGPVQISGSINKSVTSGSTKATAFTKGGAHYNPYRGGSGPNYVGYYIRPISGGIETQGLHGYNAIDIGTPVGTTLYAAAAGQVIIAKSSGWNGGYGKYIVISHGNGTQTLYGHLSQVNVNVGDTVYQGQIIGNTGNTGDSTGPHLHFEVRGAYNFMQDASEY
jgi:LysM repeat protein